jgi:hypothetical protein
MGAKMSADIKIGDEYTVTWNDGETEHSPQPSAPQSIRDRALRLADGMAASLVASRWQMLPRDGDVNLVTVMNGVWQ